MNCEIATAIIGLLLFIGFALVLADKRRSKSYEEYRGHVPPKPIPKIKPMDMPTPGHRG